jgi:Tat protein secretion system quality control protein TatD with DNase activity
VAYVAQKIAEIKGMAYEDLCERTFQNALRFLGINA